MKSANLGVSVLIFGKPNVGKSTLLNRLVQKRVALTADQPGVTRDWQSYHCQQGDLSVNILDSPGLEMLPTSELMHKMWTHVRPLLNQVDVVLWMVDGKFGLTRTDQEIVRYLQEQGLPILVVANKCEGGLCDDAQDTLWRLGIETWVEISALHGLGMRNLIDALRGFAKPLINEAQVETTDEAKPIKIIVVGRPNVGKSTFINRCLGTERLLTGPQAGITRDAIEVPVLLHKRPVTLIDTAGLRKRGQIEDLLEKGACSETFRALVFAQVAILLLDATRGLERQDVLIIDKIIQEGRALVIAVNKIDLLPEPTKWINQLKRCLDQQFANLKGINVISLSCLTGKGLSDLSREIWGVYAAWQKRIGTSALNRWLNEKLVAHPPPMIHGQRIKIKYMTQAKSRPPTFILFGTQLDELSESYQRYLINGLTQDFSMAGTSLRLKLRQSENPYDRT